MPVISQPASPAVSHAPSPAESALLRSLGARVRQRRTRCGLTRRALAQQSQVSARYLAQLESGEGNASLLVLQRIAGALAMSLAELVETPPLSSVEYVLLQEVLKTLPPAALSQLRQRLLREAGHARDNRRIALLGLRGAGKSTLGAHLAAHLDVPFIELDREIETRTGTSLQDIFLLYGQAAYRRHERRCLDLVLAEYPVCVIATGGSLVTEPATYARLLASCTTCWLKATPEEHMARVVAQGDLRPMADNAEAMADLRRILIERAPLYAQTDFTADTSGRSAADAFHTLVTTLGIERTPESP